MLNSLFCRTACGVVVGTFLAPLMSVAAAGAQSTTAVTTAQQTAASPSQAVSTVTLTGCLVRQTDSSAHPTGSTTPGAGTLSATNAGTAPAGSAAAGSVNRGGAEGDLVFVATTPPTPPARSSAVPGSIPSGTDSGTVPRHQTVAGTTGRAQGAVPSAYRLTGSQPDLARYVGQRLEVVGTVVRSTASPPDAGATTLRRGGSSSTGTRAQVADTSDAHPSADLPQLTAQTIKVVGKCEEAPPSN